VVVVAVAAVEPSLDDVLLGFVVRNDSVYHDGIVVFHHHRRLDLPLL